MSCEMCGDGEAELREEIARWETSWAALRDWLREARGRDYVTRTPAVVLQKMRDLMGDES
jgi:hypothetical protein